MNSQRCSLITIMCIGLNGTENAVWAFFSSPHLIDTSLAIFFFFVFFAFSRAAPVAYGGSQARGLIGAVAAGLCQSHSNARSKPRLQPTPQFTATSDPSPTERGQGLNLKPHGS